jgi:hypothetical protein
LRCLARSRILSHACKKQSRRIARGNNAFQAARVPFQPSVLTVSGGILGSEVAGLLLEDPIGRLQVVGARRKRRLGPQDAPAADGRGDIDLLPIEGLVMLVGQQMRRQLRLAEGRPRDAEAAQGTCAAIPGHRVAAEDMRQRPERDAELTQEQRPFEVLGTRCQVGHEERGPDAVGSAVLQADAPDRDLPLGRVAVILEPVSVGEVRGE